MKKSSKARAVPLVLPKSFLMLFSALDGAVVVAVRVDVWTVVPLMSTLVGFKLHEGISLTAVIAVVTVQLRDTAPKKPLVPTMLTVPVLPVVAPGVTDNDVVPPVLEVKPGCGVMDNKIVVVAFSSPDVPVTVIGIGLDVTEAEVPADNVSICIPDEFPGAKEAVTPLASPLAASVTVPENPPTSFTVIKLGPLLPWSTDTDAGAAVSVKPGAMVTATVTDPVTVL